MVFDNPRMIKLREKYQDNEDFEVPEVVFLDRHDGYSGERALIEQLVSSVNEEQQKRWTSDLIVDESGQHMGAWFEIMLYGWLREQFSLKVNPVINGNNPDFALNTGDRPIIIEARAYTYTPEERQIRSIAGKVVWLLQRIEKPYFLHIKENRYGLEIDQNDFLQIVHTWLESTADKELHYQDHFGNDLTLAAEYKRNQTKIAVTSSRGFWVNPEALKSQLREKAKQHRALRNAGFPYVIAIFIEPSIVDAEEVVSSWFGQTTVTYNVETEEISDEFLDRTGILYFKNSIRHRSVSGTLAFKAGYDMAKKTRYLKAWYVENPFAEQKLDPAIFDVEAKFVIVEKKEEFVMLNWVRGKGKLSTE